MARGRKKRKTPAAAAPTTKAARGRKSKKTKLQQLQAIDLTEEGSGDNNPSPAPEHPPPPPVKRKYTKKNKEQQQQLQVIEEDIGHAIEVSGGGQQLQAIEAGSSSGGGGDASSLEPLPPVRKKWGRIPKAPSSLLSMIMTRGRRKKKKTAATPPTPSTPTPPPPTTISTRVKRKYVKKNKGQPPPPQEQQQAIEGSPAVVGGASPGGSRGSPARGSRSGSEYNNGRDRFSPEHVTRNLPDGEENENENGGAGAIQDDAVALMGKIPNQMDPLFTDKYMVIMEDLIAGKMAIPSLLALMPMNSDYNPSLRINNEDKVGAYLSLKSSNCLGKVKANQTASYAMALNSVRSTKAIQVAYNSLMESFHICNNRLKDKEIECHSLTKRLQEKEDSFVLEWKDSTQEVLRETALGTSERQKYFYNNEFEAKLEANKAEYEKALVIIEKDRNGLAKENKNLLQDRVNMDNACKRQLATLNEQNAALLAKNQELEMKFEDERSRVLFLLRFLKKAKAELKAIPGGRGGLVDVEQEYGSYMRDADEEEEEEEESSSWIVVPTPPDHGLNMTAVDVNTTTNDDVQIKVLVQEQETQQQQIMQEDEGQEVQGQEMENEMELLAPPEMEDNVDVVVVPELLINEEILLQVENAQDNAQENAHVHHQEMEQETRELESPTTTTIDIVFPPKVSEEFPEQLINQQQETQESGQVVEQQQVEVEESQDQRQGEDVEIKVELELEQPVRVNAVELEPMIGSVHDDLAISDDSSDEEGDNNNTGYQGVTTTTASRKPSDSETDFSTDEIPPRWTEEESRARFAVMDGITKVLGLTTEQDAVQESNESSSPSEATLPPRHYQDALIKSNQMRSKKETEVEKVEELKPASVEVPSSSSIIIPTKSKSPPSSSSNIKARLSRGLTEPIAVSGLGGMCQKKKLELLQTTQKQQKKDSQDSQEGGDSSTTAASQSPLKNKNKKKNLFPKPSTSSAGGGGLNLSDSSDDDEEEEKKEIVQQKKLTPPLPVVNKLPVINKPRTRSLSPAKKRLTTPSPTIASSPSPTTSTGTGHSTTHSSGRVLAPHKKTDGGDSSDSSSLKKKGTPDLEAGLFPSSGKVRVSRHTSSVVNPPPPPSASSGTESETDKKKIKQEQQINPTTTGKKRGRPATANNPPVIPSIGLSNLQKDLRKFQANKQRINNQKMSPGAGAPAKVASSPSSITNKSSVSVPSSPAASQSTPIFQSPQQQPQQMMMMPPMMMMNPPCGFPPSQGQGGQPGGGAQVWDTMMQFQNQMQQFQTMLGFIFQQNQQQNPIGGFGGVACSPGQPNNFMASPPQMPIMMPPMGWPSPAGASSFPAPLQPQQQQQMMPYPGPPADLSQTSSTSQKRKFHLPNATRHKKKTCDEDEESQTKRSKQNVNVVDDYDEDEEDEEEAEQEQEEEVESSQSSASTSSSLVNNAGGDPDEEDGEISGNEADYDDQDSSQQDSMNFEDSPRSPPPSSLSGGIIEARNRNVHGNGNTFRTGLDQQQQQAWAVANAELKQITSSSDGERQGGNDSEKELMAQSLTSLMELLRDESEIRLRDDWKCLVEQSPSTLLLTELPPQDLAMLFFQAAGHKRSFPEEMSSTRAGGIYKRNSQLLFILENLKNCDPSAEMQKLPLLTLNYFVGEILPDRKFIFRDAVHLNGIGQFYGLLIDEFQIEGGMSTLLFKSLYHRPPDAQMICMASLKVNSTHFYDFDYNAGKARYPLKERVTAFCLTHIPAKFRIPKTDTIKSSLIGAYKWKIPDLTLGELLPAVMTEILEMESSGALQDAADILTLMFTLWGTEVFSYFRDLLTNVSTAWAAKQVTDGVYAAVIQSIGDMTETRLENYTPQELEPLMGYLSAVNNITDSEDSEVLKVAMDYSMKKIAYSQAPNRRKVPPLSKLFPIMITPPSPQRGGGGGRGRGGGAGRGGGRGYHGGRPGIHRGGGPAGHQAGGGINKKKKKKRGGNKNKNHQTTAQLLFKD